MMKRAAILLLSVLTAAAFLCSGCGNKNKNNGENTLYLYYKDPALRELVPVEASLDPTLSLERRISSVWRHLSDGTEYTSPVPQNVTLKNYFTDGGALILNFGSSYLAMSSSQEVLLRASLVKTFTQFPEISSVEIRVEEQPLALSDGTYVGPQQASDFVDLIGSGLNAYTETETTLYFTDEPGEYLIPTKVSIVYNNSVPLEQAVIERLILGPEEPYYRTLPEGLKLLSVSTRNTVCYVNVNSELVKDIVVSKPAVTIWSIVNSLSEISGISAVQISVNGSSNIVFMEEIDLSSPLYRSSEYDLPPDDVENSESESN